MVSARVLPLAAAVVFSGVRQGRAARLPTAFIAVLPALNVAFSEPQVNSVPNPQTQTTEAVTMKSWAFLKESMEKLSSEVQQIMLVRTFP